MKKSIYFDGVFQVVETYLKSREGNAKQANSNEDCSRLFTPSDNRLLSAGNVLFSHIKAGNLPNFGISVSSVNTSGSSPLLKRCCSCGDGVNYITKNTERTKFEGLLQSWFNGAKKWKGGGFEEIIDVPAPKKPIKKGGIKTYRI